MGAMMARPVADSLRRIVILREGVTPNQEQLMMADNSVVTSKYNVITFVPRSLFEQFRRVANIYFLVISILMVIGTYTTLFSSPLTPWSTLIPLVFVLLITMVKDGAEDLKRHRSDKRVNSTEAKALNIHTPGRFDSVEWRDVKVGMILRVEDRQEIPADLVMICSSEEGGVGYIETANIDGETNLKIRTCAPTREGQPPGPAWTTPEQLHGAHMEMEYEGPNPRIHFFTGTLTVGGTAGATRAGIRDEEENTGAPGGGGGGGGGREVPVDQSNLLLRGSRLRNTKWVLGIVAYTGKESKIAQNARAPPSKQSNLDKVTNKIMLVIFLAMASVTTFSLIGYLIFSAEYDDKLYYLCYDSENAPVALFRDNCEDSDTFSDAGQWFTFLILFNNFIPISLYVTLELVNYFHATFIDEDLLMYDVDQDTPAQARSANMSADLGQIEYVFSDKTGTLTQNLMKFKRCSVEGKIFGEIDAAAKALLTPAQLARVVDAPPLAVLGQQVASSRMDATALHFALCLALNHTVVMETDPKTGERQMQAESPDEEALVDGAKMLGIEFADRSPGKVMLDLKGRGRIEYNLIVTIPFNSTRKRMSVIVQAPDGSYTLYCKGADNIMMERSIDYADSSKSKIEEHLGVFSNDGLRTLVLAKRDFTKEFFEDWYGRYRTASVATTERAERIAEVALEVEVDLTVIGATAIEDKLQDEVPGTIADLGKAGVKLWVLTGDKMETAINIGYSCRLLEPDMTLIKLKEKKGESDSVVRQLRSLMTHFKRLVEDESVVTQFWGRVRGRGHDAKSGNSRSTVSVEEDGNAALPEPLLERPEGAPPLSDLSSDSLALILDGPSLAHVLGNPEAERMLLTLGSMCKSVVACRVSPAQKRLIVRLVKRGIVPKPVTLSIGDGANDVGMIQEAQIGIGISGKEGRQAVNNADFAIAQFRFLKRLMLVHGHWDYRRMCKVILYSFYKNIVLSFTLFYFCFYTGFSGQSLYEAYVYSGFNWFLAMPILCVGLFDQDVRSETALACHKLYAVGRQGMDLNIRVMTKWVIQALLDSLVVFFLPLKAYEEPETVWAKRGFGDGIYVFGTTVYSCLIMAMMLKVFNMTLTWTPINVFFWWGSLAFYFGFLAAYSAILYFYDFYWVAFQLMSRATYWLLFIQVPAVSWVVDSFIWMVEFMFFPTVSHHAIEFDRGYTQRDALHRLQEFKRREDERRMENEQAYASAATGIQEMPGPKRDQSNRWKVPQRSLRVLNDALDDDERQEMGITEGREGSTRSSYAFDHVTADYGPGASAPREELRNLAAEEGREGIWRARSRSMERLDAISRGDMIGDVPDSDSAAGSAYGSDEAKTRGI